MNPGKRFESRFHKSIKQLPGASYRILDGGRNTTIDVPGDFWFFSDDGYDYLIECKATKERSFPASHIRKNQVESLLAHDHHRERDVGIIALNFYGENIRRKNNCYLIRIDDFLAYLLSEGRKSIPEKAAEEIGVRCPEASGYWVLPFEELIHGNQA